MQAETRDTEFSLSSDSKRQLLCLQGYTVTHGGKGKKNTPVLSCTAVPEGAYTVSNLKQVGKEET